MAYIGNPAVDRFTSTKSASVYSGDGSAVAFTLEHSVGSDEDILVSVDGVIQEPSVAYAVSSGTTLTFTAAPSTNSGNNIFVYYLFKTIGTVTHPATSALSATSGTFSTTLAVTGASTLSSSLAMTSDDPTITMTDSSGTNDIVKLQSTSGALIITARDGNANGEIIFKGDTGSAVTEHMRINNIGAVTMPNQPAFLSGTSRVTNITGDGTSYAATAATWTDIYDQNLDFSNGTFTAPVAGKYNFTFVLTLAGTAANHANATFSLIGSNRTTTYYNAPGVDRNTSLGGTTYVLTTNLDMDASDTMHLAFAVDGGNKTVVLYELSRFSGFLVC